MTCPGGMQYLLPRYPTDDDRAAFAAHCEAELPMRSDIAYLGDFAQLGTSATSCGFAPLWSFGFSEQHTTQPPPYMKIVRLF